MGKTFYVAQGSLRLGWFTHETGSEIAGMVRNDAGYVALSFNTATNNLLA